MFSETVLDEMLLGLPVGDKEENREKAISILKDLGLEKYIDKHPLPCQEVRNKGLLLLVA